MGIDSEGSEIAKITNEPRKADRELTKPYVEVPTVHIPTEVRTRVNDSLSEEPFVPGDLIQAFKGVPELAELFGSKNGTWDDGNWDDDTIEGHTLKGARQFERYCANGWASPVLDVRHMRLAYGGHDIGKPLAIQAGDKDTQHVYTAQILQQVLPQLGEDDETITKMIGIIDQDFIGDLMAKKKSPQQVAEDISQRATALEIPLEDYVDIITSFYMVDAGAYTVDAGGSRQLDVFFHFDRADGQETGTVTFSQRGQKQYDELTRELLKYLPAETVLTKLAGYTRGTPGKGDGQTDERQLASIRATFTELGTNDTSPKAAGSDELGYNKDYIDDLPPVKVLRGPTKSRESQDAPIPSFEDTQEADITPVFNPTGAPPEEIYARNRRPMKLEGTQALHSEFGHTDPVEMWRIVDRARLIDGTGLVSSQILRHGTLGDIEHFRGEHDATSHEGRVSDGQETPYVSFVTDPDALAKVYILRNGYGIKDGRDSVIVRVKVDPSRVITGGKNKEGSVTLVGGVSPEEYVAAYEMPDFVSTLVPVDSTINVRNGHRGGTMTRDEALRYWAENDSI